MGQIEQRLEYLNITLPQKDRKGKGTVPVKQVGDLLFVSAMLPLDENGSPVFTGRVGTDLTREQGYDAARLCCINMLGHAADYIGSLDRVAGVVKVLGLVNSGGDFSEQPFVINGFSDMLLEVFGERGVHARSAMGAYNLPQNCAVTVDCILSLR